MTHPLDLAKRMRSDPTDAEGLLWARVRRSALGVKFRRQVPLGRAIVDFYCPAAKLVVEVDGAHHLDPDGLEHDEERTAKLRSRGLTVVRFLDNEVLNETDAVVEQLAELVRPFGRS